MIPIGFRGPAPRGKPGNDTSSPFCCKNLASTPFWDNLANNIQQLVAFNVGYSLQDIQKAVYIGLGGTALTFLITVPPWPFYKTKPVKWLPAGAGMPGGIYSQSS